MTSNSTFNTTQYDAAYPNGIGCHYWQLARASVVYKTLSNIGATNEKVLEVGCGKGVVVNALRKIGLDAFGVELAAIDVSFDLAGYIDVGVDACDLPQTQRESYTVLLLLDVIEHIDVPEDFIQNLVDAFPNVKNIVITVPARKEIWSKFDEYYGHYRRYDLNSVRALSSQLNLDLKGERYFFHSLYFMALLSRVLKLGRSTKISAPTSPMLALHRIIARILEVEFLLKLKRLYGSSIVFTLSNKNSS